MKTKNTINVSDITPGEILAKDWIKPNDLTHYEVSIRTGIPASRLTEIAVSYTHLTLPTILRV